MLQAYVSDLDAQQSSSAERTDHPEKRPALDHVRCSASSGLDYTLVLRFRSEPAPGTFNCPNAIEASHPSPSKFPRGLR